MSMGLVLHASWIMTPHEVGAPRGDASGIEFMKYMTGGIHLFRMQLFFVLAGFFACLLVRKRGVRSFAWNRFQRVALPLAVFWCLLWPVMMTQWMAGRQQSGALPLPYPAWQITIGVFQNMTFSTTATFHLWFLYYLCLIYVGAIGIRSALLLIDRQGVLRTLCSNVAGYIVSRRWNVLALALITAPALFLCRDFAGIGNNRSRLEPDWGGLASYAIYFVVGWFIFRNAERLPGMLRGWKWCLAAGVLMTIPSYYFSIWAQTHGYETPAYPFLTNGDVQYDEAQQRYRYPEFRDQLLAAEPGSAAFTIRQNLPDDIVKYVAAHESLTENQLAGFLEGMNKSVLADPEFLSEADLSRIPLPNVVDSSIGRSTARLNQAEVTLMNRAVLNASFDGVFHGRDRDQPNYTPIRVAFCYLYSLGSWLMIVGCLGFSQHFFPDQNRFWRYFSDASYWFYLLHLPIQAQFLYWFGGEPWHWSLKFGLYVFGTLAILLPTYHYLVRPSWIGWLLNGRRFPVWRLPSKEQTVAESEPIEKRLPA